LLAVKNRQLTLFEDPIVQKVIRLTTSLLALLILMVSATSSAQLSSFKECGQTADAYEIDISQLVEGVKNGAVSHDRTCPSVARRLYY
jgi:hypothetical protein